MFEEERGSKNGQNLGLKYDRSTQIAFTSFVPTFTFRDSKFRSGIKLELLTSTFNHQGFAFNLEST